MALAYACSWASARARRRLCSRCGVWALRGALVRLARPITAFHKGAMLPARHCVSRARISWRVDCCSRIEWSFGVFARTIRMQVGSARARSRYVSCAASVVARLKLHHSTANASAKSFLVFDGTCRSSETRFKNSASGVGAHIVVGVRRSVWHLFEFRWSGVLVNGALLLCSIDSHVFVVLGGCVHGALLCVVDFRWPAIVVST